jgi:hypothetical protein
MSGTSSTATSSVNGDGTGSPGALSRYLDTSERGRDRQTRRARPLYRSSTVARDGRCYFIDCASVPPRAGKSSVSRREASIAYSLRSPRARRPLTRAVDMARCDSPRSRFLLWSDTQPVSWWTAVRFLLGCRARWPVENRRATPGADSEPTDGLGPWRSQKRLAVTRTSALPVACRSLEPRPGARSPQ